jgi:hypothetical protein
MSSYIETTDQMRVAFIAEDAGTPSIVEGGIDNFQLEIITCGSACPGDINADGEVGVTDLLSIIAAWGSDDPLADIDGDGIVGVGDLLTTIGNWGSCDE